MKLNKNIITNISIMFISLIFISCSDSDDYLNIQVAGIYYGTIKTNTESKKSALDSIITSTAFVRIIDDKIEVNFLNDNFNHTIILNVFEEGSLVRTCLTGEDFEMKYDHILGHGKLNDYAESTNSQWMQHLILEHTDSDEHYGVFDKFESSFDYKFEIGNTEYHFHGIKEEIYF